MAGGSLFPTVVVIHKDSGHERLIANEQQKVVQAYLNVLYRIFVPIGIMIGLLAALDIVPATMNAKKYTGLQGLAIGILFIPVFIMILTLSQWIVLAIGLKLFKTGIAISNLLRSSKTK